MSCPRENDEEIVIFDPECPSGQCGIFHSRSVIIPLIIILSDLLGLIRHEVVNSEWCIRDCIEKATLLVNEPSPPECVACNGDWSNELLAKLHGACILPTWEFSDDCPKCYKRKLLHDNWPIALSFKTGLFRLVEIYQAGVRRVEAERVNRKKGQQS